MFKTITKYELKVLLSVIDKYFKHLIDNPYTLIAKIYGIYEFLNLDNEKIYLILMQNVAGCPK